MQTRPMEPKQKQRSERFKRKVLARWRLLAASGVSPEQAALEIGVTVVELREWWRGVEVEAPLLVPVQVAGETAERRALVWARGTEDEAPLLVAGCWCRCRSRARPRSGGGSSSAARA